MYLNYVAPYKLEKANSTDAGFDLRSTETVEFEPGDVRVVSTGCSLQRDYDHLGRFKHIEIHLRGRSSLAVKGFITHFGTIDETYNSEIKVVMAYFGKEKYTINKNDKIAQLVFCYLSPVELTAVEHIDPNREGFGSSGVQ